MAKKKEKIKERQYSLNILEKPKKPAKKRASLLSMNSLSYNNQEFKENNKESTGKFTGRKPSQDLSPKEKENDKNESNLTSNRQKNSKKLIYKFIPLFDLTDLEINNQEIKADSEEITKVLLRYLSGINKLYHYINKMGKIEIVNEETGKPNMILTSEQMKVIENNFLRKSSRTMSLSKSFKNQNKKALSKKSIASSLMQLNSNLIPKIEEQLKSDDINFCIQLKDFWYYAREFGLFNDSKISIAEFNRLFDSGKNNFYESFKVPRYLTESDDIYKYLNAKINQSKHDFVLKYKNYLNYYYREDEDKKDDIFRIIENKNNKIDLTNSVHDERRLLLPRFFYECLIRLAYLVGNYSPNYAERNLKLSKKLERILDVIIPSRMRKKQNSSLKITMAKLEQSFNNSINVIEGNMTRITEMKTIEEFVNLFVKDLKYIFDKIYILYKEKENINFSKNGDRTITHLFFYRNIISKNIFLRQSIPNVISYIEIISSFLNNKLNFIENLTKYKKSDYFDIINDMLLKEMTEWEFDEIIFLICRNYIKSINKKLNENDLRIFLGKIKENIDKIVRSKLLKKKYYFPKLKSHIMKEELIEEEKRRREEERRIKLERERYFNERNNFQKEDVNAFVENPEEEEVEDVEDTEEIFN